jgi:enediyne biosynthesis protein E4
VPSFFIFRFEIQLAMWRYLGIVVFIFLGCTKPEDLATENYSRQENSLFTRLTPDDTGIHFINQLIEQEDFDVFRYRNYYNGGGVGIGDFNNDGLPDVFLTSNMGDNRLFLNKGNWKFEDISAKAGVKGIRVWSTGVSIADVNADGFLDIYVCNAGDVKGNNRENELFINNGDLTFHDKAAEYGLADKGFTTHAAFFDFDKDGDLDCYVLNNSYRPVSTLGYRNLRNERDEFGGHKLYRNDNGFFRDISEKAGIYGSVIGFGLGVTVADVNQDQWPDLYVANDFYERDYLYINNQDGTYREELEKHMGHISMFSMGADVADLNNDGYPEVFSTDMLPQDDYRLKTLIAFETYDVYKLRLKNGYYHQFMRNMLHKNNRDGTFSEIGNMAAVDATDWSWGALLADFNNDRYKEIFVCNGIYKDLINQDFIEYLGSNEQMKAAIDGKKVDFKQFVERMPTTKLSNYMFTRQSDWRYTNVAKEWGLGDPGFSNGAAYGDLDRDGDHDLIINNVNQELFIYKNGATEKTGNHFLKINFKGIGKNTFALGSSVKAFVGNEVVSMDHMPIRGFQSSMDYTMVLGLGDASKIDSMIVTWPDQRVTVLHEVTADQTLSLDNETAVSRQVANRKVTPYFTALKDSTVKHVENDFNDFDRDRLLYHMLSTQGPASAKTDLNGDKLDDLFIGGSLTSNGKIFIQASDGKFSAVTLPEATNLADQTDAAFFDADSDGDSDLYIVTGGSEHLSQSQALQDIYLENKGLKNGKPVFENASDRLPKLSASGSCVRPADFDNDGDVDLFIGTRVIPSYYGLPCDQVMLINDGKGNFSDGTMKVAPELRSFGMVTDAVWVDDDKDGYPELMIVGDWLPVSRFRNERGILKQAEPPPGLKNTEGWWTRIRASDIDADGDTDFVLGNLGMNSKFRPTAEIPVKLYVNDFDQNGSIEPIFAFPRNGREYPYALRQDIIKQMSSLKKKFVLYKDYANKSLDEIFDPKLLANADKWEFKEARSGILLSNANNAFQFIPFPVEAQVSPVYGITVMDVNHDNLEDIIIGGNLSAVKPEVGKYDALFGLLLINKGNANFQAEPSWNSGLVIEGEVRHIETLRTKKGSAMAFIRNNDPVLFYQLNNAKK